MVVDRSPIVVILCMWKLYRRCGGIMNWLDIDENERNLIVAEDALFIDELKNGNRFPPRPEVQYILSKESSLSLAINAVKDDFISSFTLPPNTIAENLVLKKYKRHFQRQCNIYFRYGCELVCFCENPQNWPMVAKIDENNVIVPPGEGEISLPEYFKKYKNGTALIPLNKELQINTFSNVMPHNFLWGKEHFLDLFLLEISDGFTLSTEELYLSYYIAWKSLSCKPQTSYNLSDLIEKGKAFLEFIFLKKEPKIMPETDGYDLTEYFLTGWKNYKDKKEFKKTYHEELPSVLQRTAHTFPDFEKTIYPNGETGKGLLSRVKDHYIKLTKEEDDSRTFDAGDWTQLKKYRREIEELLEDIVDTYKCATHCSPDDKNNAEQCLKDLKYSYNGNPCNLPRILQCCCELTEVMRQLQSYEKIKKFILKMLNVPYIRKAISIDSPKNEYDGRSILDTDEANKEDEEEITYNIMPLTSGEGGNNTLILFFKVAFVNFTSKAAAKKATAASKLNVGNFLIDIEEFLNRDPVNFRKVLLHTYSNSNKTRNNGLKKIFTDQLEPTIPQNDIDFFNDFIRYEILLPIFSENIILFGRERLQNIFSCFFPAADEEPFLDSVFDIINNFFDGFDLVIFRLFKLFLRNAGNKTESVLRQEYQEALYPDMPWLPPYIEELELRKAINEFIESKSESGDFWILRNAVLKTFPCFQKKNDWRDLLFNLYVKKTKCNIVTEEIFKERIGGIRDAINKEEIIRYGKI